ncbi:hypothetical protein F5884DRAFT_789307 [Xylogone sp. PMI_703]|nr:hypothetical protein F5884DRAFT_789307 [Xylogone sp. PMI_703]
MRGKPSGSKLHRLLYSVGTMSDAGRQYSRWQRLRFCASLAFIGFTMGIAFIYSLVAHPLFYLLRRHDLAQYTTSLLWWYLTAPFLGIALEVEGYENLYGWGGRSSRSCVFVSNHQNELDVLFVGRLWQPHTVSCATWRVKSMPAFGVYMQLCRTVFVDPPASSHLSNKQILTSTTSMIRREGMNLWIFPEGVRSYSKKPMLLPLKRGALVVAMNAGVPIVPVVIGNSSHIYHLPEKIFGPGIVKVRVLKPIETVAREDEGTDETLLRLQRELHDAMLESLEQM